MAGLRFRDLHARPTELLDLTSLTGEEFHCLVPAFEIAFHTRMATWRLDGKPRTARCFSVYTPCPLPTREDRLLFILVYLKTYALQVVQGRLFGMGQSKANQWIHVLLPVLRAALDDVVRRDDRDTHPAPLDLREGRRVHVVAVAPHDHWLLPQRRDHGAD